LLKNDDVSASLSRGKEPGKMGMTKRESELEEEKIPEPEKKGGKISVKC